MMRNDDHVEIQTGIYVDSDHANVRRAVSEGLRVWTSRPYFKNNPQIAIQLLSAHREDESEYVRESVGNSLKDISKKYPGLISRELNSWDLSLKESKQVYKPAGKFLEKTWMKVLPVKIRADANSTKRPVNLLYFS